MDPFSSAQLKSVLQQYYKQIIAKCPHLIMHNLIFGLVDKTIFDDAHPYIL